MVGKTALRERFMGGNFNPVYLMTIGADFAVKRVELDGKDTAKQACFEMLLGKDRDPRIFIKPGHYNPETGKSYIRISPPIDAITKELIDLAVEKTIEPVLRDARR